MPEQRDLQAMVGLRREWTVHGFAGRQNERVRRRIVFPQFADGRIRRGFKDVGVETGAIEQAGFTLRFAGDADQFFETVAECAAPGGTGIVRQAHGPGRSEPEPVARQW